MSTEREQEAIQQINKVVTEATKRAGEAGAAVGVMMSSVINQATAHGEQVVRAFRQASLTKHTDGGQ